MHDADLKNYKILYLFLAYIRFNLLTFFIHTTFVCCMISNQLCYCYAFRVQKILHTHSPLFSINIFKYSGRYTHLSVREHIRYAAYRLSFILHVGTSTCQSSHITCHVLKYKCMRLHNICSKIVCKLNSPRENKSTLWFTLIQ